MNELANILLKLKKQCVNLGEDLYAIEIGENTLEELNKNLPEEERGSEICYFLGAKIFLHRRILSDHSTNELLDEIKKRNEAHIKFMKMKSDIQRHLK